MVVYNRGAKAPFGFGFKKSYEEDVVQRGIVGYLRGQGYLLTSTGAGLIKSARTQITMLSLGYLKGSPDIIVWIKGGTLNIECKAPKKYCMSRKTGKMIVYKQGGVQSDSQKQFEGEIKGIEGHHYIVATCSEDVVNYIKENRIEPR